MLERILNTKLKAIWKLVFLVYIALILFLCFGQFDSMEDVPRFILGIPSDKVVHFLMFTPFTFFVGLAFFFKYIGKSKYIPVFIMTGMVMGFLFAITTEVGQHYIPYREADPFDFIADATGIIFGGCLVFLIDHFRTK